MQNKFENIKKFKKGELDLLIKNAILGIESEITKSEVSTVLSSVSSLTDTETEKRIFQAIKDLYLKPTKQPKTEGKGIQLNSGHTLEAVLRATLEYLYYYSGSGKDKVKYIEEALKNNKQDSLSALLGGDIEISQGKETAKIQVKSNGASMAIYRPVFNLQEATNGGQSTGDLINFLKDPLSIKPNKGIREKFLDSALNTYINLSAANLYMVGLTAGSGVDMGGFTTWDSKGKESNRTLTFGALVSMMVAVQLRPEQFKSSIAERGLGDNKILKLDLASSSNEVKKQKPRDVATLFDMIMDSKIKRNRDDKAKIILEGLKNQDSVILKDLIKLTDSSGALKKEEDPSYVFMQLFDKILNSKMRFFPDVRYSQEMVHKASVSGNNEYALHAPSGRLLYLSLSALVSPLVVENYFNRWRSIESGGKGEQFYPLFGQPIKKE